ncbi:MAG: hypothetical protein ACRDDA_00925 [Aeromonas sp.]
MLVKEHLNLNNMYEVYLMTYFNRMMLAGILSVLMIPTAHAGLFSKLDELKVKGSEIEGCPGVTLKEQADKFFKDPDWSAGKSADGRKLVNVSGTFTYGDRPVRGMLQMWLQGDDFTVETLEINGEPQTDVMLNALLSKMCEAAKGEVTTPVAEPEKPDLPFIGKRSFNFEGGTGTDRYITIEPNGQTRVEMCGASLMGDNGEFQEPSCMVVYNGPFTNPLKMESGLYRIKGDRIYVLGDKGEDLTCEVEEGIPGDAHCSVELYTEE